MFEDLVQRAKNHGDNARVEHERREEVKLLIREYIESIVPEIEALGFENVKFIKLHTSFSLRIQPRRGYSESRFTHNMEISSTKSQINYGSGANSATGKAMEFDYNWNDSQIIAVTKNAVRALVGSALETREYVKAKGWG